MILAVHSDLRNVIRQVGCTFLVCIAITACCRSSVISLSSFDLGRLKRGEYWNPVFEDKNHGERLARWYVKHKLGVKESQLSILETQVTGRFDNENHRLLCFQFYNPSVFGIDEGIGVERVLGGFPDYFEVYVDVQAWRVVGHDASLK